MKKNVKLFIFLLLFKKLNLKGKNDRSLLTKLIDPNFIIC